MNSILGHAMSGEFERRVCDVRFLKPVGDPGGASVAAAPRVVFKNKNKKKKKRREKNGG